MNAKCPECRKEIPLISDNGRIRWGSHWISFITEGGRMYLGSGTTGEYKTKPCHNSYRFLENIICSKCDMKVAVYIFNVTPSTPDIWGTVIPHLSGPKTEYCPGSGEDLRFKDLVTFEELSK